MKDKSSIFLIVSSLVLVILGIFIFSSQRVKEGQQVGSKEVSTTHSYDFAFESQNTEEEEELPLASFRFPKEDAEFQSDHEGKGKRKAGVIEGEAVVQFDDEEAYQKFLEQAENGKFEVISTIPALNAARVIGDANELQKLIDGSAAFTDNVQVSVPDNPQRLSDGPQQLTGIGPLHSWLGLDEISSEWGKEMVVAVLDNGTLQHPALDGAILERIDLVTGSASGSVDGAMQEVVAQSDDSSGHGTAVASLIAGWTEEYKGLAPSAKLLDIRVLGSGGTGDTFTVAEGIVRAVEGGAQVINTSLGAYGESSILKQAVDYAESQGSVVVGASGNDGYAQLVYPARYESVLSVGAVDGNRRYAYFSNGGEGLDVVAPGVGLQAAWSGGNWVNFSGTSAATPVVSGLVAAIASLEGGDAVFARNLVMQYLDEAGEFGSDARYGSGIISMKRVLEREENGIYDVAVMSHNYIPSGSRPLPRVQSTVQNRGTEVVFNISHTMSINGVPLTFTVARLEVGEVVMHELDVQQNLNHSGPLTIISEVSLLSDPDSVPSNNTKSSTLSRVE